GSVKRVILSACVCVLGSCAAPRETATTLASLEKKHVAIERDAAVGASRSAAIQAYRKFLDAAPRDRLRPEAMRRLGDLQIEGAREDSADAAGARQYRDPLAPYEGPPPAHPEF